MPVAVERACVGSGGGRESATPPSPPPSANPFASDPAASHFPPPPPNPPGSNPICRLATARLGTAQSLCLTRFGRADAVFDALVADQSYAGLARHDLQLRLGDLENNLGLLVGVTLVIGVANYAVMIPFNILQFVFMQQKEQEAAMATVIVGQIVVNLVQLYLGIGAMQINLKLARRQPATFGDLFGGMNRFFPLLGGAHFCLPGFDRRCSVPDRPRDLDGPRLLAVLFSDHRRQGGCHRVLPIAQRITHGNWASFFVLWIMSVGISIVGCLAVCIGNMIRRAARVDDVCRRLSHDVGPARAIWCVSDLSRGTAAGTANVVNRLAR